MKNGPYELIIPPVSFPGKRYRGKYAYEHIVVFWRVYGRLPRKGYIIHHKDDNKRNNIIDNLQELTVQEHNLIHGADNRKPIIHGTLHAYRHGLCRCDLCRKSQAEDMAERRRKWGRAGSKKKFIELNKGSINE